MKLTDALEVQVYFGPGPQSLLDLIDAWAGRVLKLLADTAPDVDAGGGATWTIHDLVGALYLRDAIERGLQDLLRRTAGTAVMATVMAIDELFNTFTLDDVHGVIHLVDAEAPDSPWWWGRVPMNGPVADEAREIANRSTDGG